MMQKFRMKETELDRQLVLSCINADFHGVKKYINQGANPNHNKGEPLYWVCKDDTLDIFEYLVNQGANPDFPSGTLLILACTFCHTETIRHLVEKYGVNIHAQNEGALTAAIEYSHLDTVKYLIERGANYNLRYKYYLKCANSEILTYLKTLRE